MSTSKVSLISIIIPAYNASPFIERAVASCISSENYGIEDGIEVIIVDDGSTDATSSLVDEMAARDKRVIAVHQENRGLAEARNTGLRHAKGKYIVLLDADDELAAGWLLISASILEKNDLLDGVYGDYALHWDSNGFIEQKRVTRELSLSNLLHNNFIPVSSLFLRRSLYHRLGQFDANLPTHEDWHYWLRAANEGWRLQKLEVNSCIIHAHGYNMSTNWRAMSAGRLACLHYAENHFHLNDDQIKVLRARRAVECFFVELEEYFSTPDRRQALEVIRSLLQQLEGLTPLYRRSLTATRVLLLLLLWIGKLITYLRIPYNPKLRTLLGPIRARSHLAMAVSSNPSVRSQGSR